jgi:hypothetical protein
MRTLLLLTAVVTVLASGMACQKGALSKAPSSAAGAGAQPADPRTDCDKDDCKAPDTWFPKTPPVAADFPKVDAPECDFYKWAWQSFLYLTQSEKDGDAPRFILFDTPNDLFKKPDGQMLQMAAAPRRDPAKKHILSLAVRNSPGVTHNIQAKAFAQAGSQGVVVDRNGRCLYYGQHINSNFVTFIRGPKEKGNLGLTTADQINDVDPEKAFPEGCLELKSAWRALTDDEKKPDNLRVLRQSFFITEAQVPTLVEVTGATGKVIKADANKPRPEMVALMSLHVVGVTPDHHEFVWSSFEHVANSPTQFKLLDPGNTTPVDSTKDYTFYRKGTPTNKSNVNPVPDESTTPQNPLKLVDPDKQTLSPVVDIFREYNSGDDFIKPDDDVCPLNKSVRSKLAATPSLSLWSNYQLIGAVWLKDPATDFKAGKTFPVHVPPTGPTPAEQKLFAGERLLSNSTMETFTQHKNANCFACHNTQKEVNENGKELKGLKIKISHVVRNAYLGAPQ